MNTFFVDVSCNLVSFVVGSILMLILTRTDKWEILLDWQFWVQTVTVGVIMGFLTAFVSHNYTRRQS